MAEKHGDKVKRGFVFYLFMLLLVLVAAFLIVIMIMLFLPEKSILGFVYFNYDKTYTVVNSTDTDSRIDYSKITKVVVDSTYANIKIHSDIAEDSPLGVKITNKAVGFVQEKDFNGFTYSVTTTDEGNTLNVSVEEPNSFLYFSKNVTVDINLKPFSYSLFLDNVENIVVNTQSGNVNISPSFVNCNISLTATAGNIYMGDENKEEVFVAGTLYLSTISGDINIEKNLHLTASKFSTQTGNIKVQDLYVVSVELSINKGSFTARKLDNTAYLLDLTGGRIDIEYCANFEANDSENITRSSINFGTIENISIPFGNDCNITIKQLRENGFIHTTSGNITISEDAGRTILFKTVSGNINLTFNQEVENIYVREIESQSGNINLTFKSKIENMHYVKTNGNVLINIAPENHFTLDLRYANDTPIKKLGSKVNIDFIDDEIYEREYPFRVNLDSASDQSVYQKNQIIVNSDGNIKVHLMGE